MTPNEKLIIGSTAVITVSALTILLVSKKYTLAAQEVVNNVKDVNFIMSKCRDDIIIGNRELAEGNRILRGIVKKSSENIVDAKK